MAARSQPYRVEWPLNPLSAEQIDEMFQILFDDMRNGNLEVEIDQITDLPLTPPDGGTGLTSYSIGDILYADDTDSLATLGIGTPQYVLQVNAAGDAPEWGLVAFDNMVPAAAASTLIGRRLGSTGNWEAVTLGTGLAMDASAVLTASGGVAVGDGYWSPLMTGLSLTSYAADSEMVLDADGDAVMVWIET